MVTPASQSSPVEPSVSKRATPPPGETLKTSVSPSGSIAPMIRLSESIRRLGLAAARASASLVVAFGSISEIQSQTELEAIVAS